MSITLSESLQKIIIEQLTLEEGYKLKRYKCTEGHWTIGKGYNLDANSLKLSQEEINHLVTYGCSAERADAMLMDCVKLFCLPECQKYPFWDELCDVRKYVLIGMIYQMGSIKSWTHTLDALKNKKYPLAAAQMLQSKWAKQTPNRAVRLADMMKTGELE